MEKSNAARQDDSAVAENTDQPLSVKDRIALSLGKLGGLEAIEELIKAKIASEAELLHDIPSYLLSLGGKRIRPALALMSGRVFGMEKPDQRLVDVSAGIELIHMATLLHDDIIDNSPVRRHKPSPYARYGLTNTLLSGDFLLVRAFSLCARLDRFIVDATEVACIELTEGEISEVSLDQVSHTLESSLEIARKKTASLFRLASVCGAYLASADAEAVRLMGRFGEHLGVAFQILDDILDVTSEENLLGKKSGMDIRERKPSIVNVLWLQSGSPLAKRLLTSVPEGDLEELCGEALRELRGSAVVERAKEQAKGVSFQAAEALDAALARIPGHSKSDADALRALIEYSLDRVS